MSPPLDVSVWELPIFRPAVRTSGMAPVLERTWPLIAKSRTAFKVRVLLPPAVLAMAVATVRSPLPPAALAVPMVTALLPLREF